MRKKEKKTIRETRPFPYTVLNCFYFLSLLVYILSNQTVDLLVIKPGEAMLTAYWLPVIGNFLAAVNFKTRFHHVSISQNKTLHKYHPSDYIYDLVRKCIAPWMIPGLDNVKCIPYLFLSRYYKPSDIL